MRLTANNSQYTSLFHTVFLDKFCYIGVGKVSVLPFLCYSLTFALVVLSSIRNFFAEIFWNRQPLWWGFTALVNCKYSQLFSRPRLICQQICWQYLQNMSRIPPSLPSPLLLSWATVTSHLNYFRLTSLPASSFLPAVSSPENTSHCDPSQMEVRACPHLAPDPPVVSHSLRVRWKGLTMACPALHLPPLLTWP